MLQLGLRLHDAEPLPLEELLSLVREQGFTCAHLALKKLFRDRPCTPAALTPGYAQYLKNVFARSGIDIALFGSYCNLLHPDEAAVREATELCCASIRFASLLGCGMVGTETGAPNREYRFCPECRDEKTLSLFIRRLKPVVRCAEQFGVILAIEPSARHCVWGPEPCRRVLDEIGSPCLQVIFDPVNMLDRDNLDRRDEVFQQAIELLGKDIAMIHLKDFVRADSSSGFLSVGAGTGEMDYSMILGYVKREKPFLYATLENTVPENAAACRAAMERAWEEA